MYRLLIAFTLCLGTLATDGAKPQLRGRMQRQWEGETSPMVVPMVKRVGKKSIPRAVGRVATLRGNGVSTYMADVKVGGEHFQVQVDTGSSVFAVVAMPIDNCSRWYKGSCDGPLLPLIGYGSGNWTGSTCGGADVVLAGLSAGSPPFGGIQFQDDFLDCDSFPSFTRSQGILGMAYNTPTMMSGFPGVPLFDSIMNHTGIPNVFSMQCCGWDGNSSKPGTGRLVLGGVHYGAYTGDIQYTAITQEQYYCVNLTQISLGNASGSLAKPRCNAVVDSGTSIIVLPAALAARFGSVLGCTANDCVEPSAVHRFPDLVIKLGGGVTLRVPPTKYFLHYNTTCMVAGIQSSGDLNGNEAPPIILGQPLMETYYTVFDRVNKRVGFAPNAGC